MTGIKVNYLKVIGYEHGRSAANLECIDLNGNVFSMTIANMAHVLDTLGSRTVLSDGSIQGHFVTYSAGRYTRIKCEYHNIKE